MRTRRSRGSPPTTTTSRIGCWDLVLWAERAVAFAAVVSGGPGARGGAQGSEGSPRAGIGEARTRWLAAAVKTGLSASQFVVVEWDYRRVVVRRKRSG